MFKHLLSDFIISGLMMKHNIDWHRRLIAISVPIFLVLMILQAEYIIFRAKAENA